MLLLIFREWTGTQKKFPMFDLTFEIQLKLSLTIHSLQLHKTKAVCSGSLGRYVAFCTSHNVRWHFSIALVLFNLNCATCRETKPLFLLFNLFSQHTEAVERWLLAQQCRDSTFFLIYFSLFFSLLQWFIFIQLGADKNNFRKRQFSRECHFSEWLNFNLNEFAPVQQRFSEEELWLIYGEEKLTQKTASFPTWLSKGNF